jgi:hypothetical protein
LDNFQEVGASGLNKGLAHETKARIAILKKDNERFQVNARLCHEQYIKGEKSMLLKKFETLISQASHAGVVIPFDLLGAVGRLDESESVNTEIVASILTKHRKFRERIQYALDLLVKNSNSKGGFLYLVQNDEIALFATHGDFKISSEFHSWVTDYFRAQLDDTDATRSVTIENDLEESVAEPSLVRTDNSEYRYPLLLRHLTENGYAITGLAVLMFANGEQPQIPPGLNTALSRFLNDFGDVSSYIPEDQTS